MRVNRWRDEGQLGRHGRVLTTVVLQVLTIACGAVSDPRPGALFSGATMGTRYTVRVDDVDAHGAREVIDERITETLDRIDRRMSTYRADSEISTLNRASANQPVRLSPETAEVLQAAIEMAADTGGAFDVTAGPLVNAWGFGPPGRIDELPSDAELAAALGHVGADKLKLDVSAVTVTKLDAHAYVDLSGIAKGYAVDAVVADLAGAGWDNVMVDIGGEVRTRGRTTFGRPWRIAIEAPGAGGTAPLVVALDGALATSGSYRNAYFLDDTPVSHTLDPRTGRPVAHGGVSVSVLADACMTADALATALMVMGPDDGIAWATQRDIAALFVVRAGDSFVRRTTPAYQRHAAAELQ